MDLSDLYKYYIPAIVKALANDHKGEQFAVQGPSFYIEASDDKILEIELYIDEIAGENTFLDNVGYYFDAKSHGFSSVNGVEIELFKSKLENELIKIKKEYLIG